jgi:hypothetical protein
MRRPCPTGGCRTKIKQTYSQAHAHLPLYSFYWHHYTSHHPRKHLSKLMPAPYFFFFSFVLRCIPKHTRHILTTPETPATLDCPSNSSSSRRTRNLSKFTSLFVPLVSKVFFCIVKPLIWLTTIKLCLTGWV